MMRAILEALGLFLIPFALYAAWLMFRARHPAAAAQIGDGPLLNLCLVGLALVLAGFLALGWFSPRRGAYVPAHVEDGRLIPGRLQ